MKMRRSGAHTPKCERLEARQMLAADLGAEISSFTEGDVETVVVSSSSDTHEKADDSDRREAATSTDAVLEWNDLFGELLVADQVTQNPGYASRSMAMLNLAIYDAVTIASGDAENAFYDYSLDLAPNANIDADIAATQAAYTVLSGLYPDQQSTIDAFYQDAIDSFRQSRSAAESLAAGEAIGNAILVARADDGSADQVTYSYTDEVGYFHNDPLNPDVPAWGPGWGDVDPFVVSSAEGYAPETTPPLDSAEYAASYNEVFELGSVDSDLRTAEQTEIGIFWAYDREGLGTPMALFGDIMETIAVQQGNTLKENAALFAQASVAMADAGIVAWHTKFTEEFWRPVTAIRAGDADGNELTAGDADWTPLGAPDGGDDIVGFTPQFPTYISGHATFGGALFGAIREFYGTDDISFTVSSEELEILMENPVLQAAYGLDLTGSTRTFDSLTQAMAENGRSRVYLGIHFDFDDTVGQDVGQAVASAVATEFVVPEEISDGRRMTRDPRMDVLRDGEGVRGRRAPRVDVVPSSFRRASQRPVEAVDDVMQQLGRDEQQGERPSRRVRQERPERAIDGAFADLGERAVSDTIDDGLEDRRGRGRRR